jgi:hypothetical protein
VLCNSLSPFIDLLALYYLFKASPISTPPPSLWTLPIPIVWTLVPKLIEPSFFYSCFFFLFIIIENLSLFVMCSAFDFSNTFTPFVLLNTLFVILIYYLLCVQLLHFPLIVIPPPLPFSCY